jgi:hypothetical protein
MATPELAGGPWLALNSGPGEPARNMALDEALLETVAEIGRPVLRFYGWTEAAATFGYSQRYGDLEKATALRPLIRRPTGGGLVPHNADWTYSLVFPPGHFWHRLRAEESYQKAHEWVGLAFARLGVATTLSPCCRKEIPGQCFAGAEKYDLLWGRRKIAGAAQRRPRTGLLIQGSVQPPPFGLAAESHPDFLSSKLSQRTAWETAMLETGVEVLRGSWTRWVLPEPLSRRAESLRAEKYARADYNRKR